MFRMDKPNPKAYIGYVERCSLAITKRLIEKLDFSISLLAVWTFLQRLFIFCNMQQSISRVLSLTVIYLECMSPHISCHRFGRCRADLASRSGVAPSGVYSTPLSPMGWVSSYLAFPPLPALSRRYISVALSLESPPQAVSLHPCPMELGLSSHTGLLHICATICTTAFVT